MVSDGKTLDTNHLKKMKSKALRQYQEHWVRERRDWKILTRGRGVVKDKLIPERGRLAQKMAADRDVAGLSVFKISPSSIFQDHAPSMALAPLNTVNFD
jgi:hypothetical protein